MTILVDVSTGSVPGLIVKRDGLPIGTGAWGTPSPVDPGEHEVEATAPGKRPWKVSVTIGAAADLQTVKVPLLDDEPTRPTAVASASPPLPVPASPGRADSVAPSDGISLRFLGIVVGGVGIVGLGMSAYFGLHAKSLDADSTRDGHCKPDNKCDATGYSLRSDAVNASNAATIALVAGGALAAAGVTLFLVGSPKEAKPDAATVAATPVAGLGMAALLVQGRF
jgi:hypothetical protein